MKRTRLKSGKGLNKGFGTLSSKKALKSHKNMQYASNKKKERDKEKVSVYKKIDSTRKPECEGCGCSSRPLSHSHLVPVGYDSSLEAEERNIRLHCLSYDGDKGCHEKWEDGIQGEIDQLFDFEENMQIVKTLNFGYFKIKYLSIYDRAFEESV